MPRSMWHTGQQLSHCKKCWPSQSSGSIHGPRGVTGEWFFQSKEKMGGRGVAFPHDKKRTQRKEERKKERKKEHKFQNKSAPVKRRMLLECLHVEHLQHVKGG